MAPHLARSQCPEDLQSPPESTITYRGKDSLAPATLYGISEALRHYHKVNRGKCRDGDRDRNDGHFEFVGAGHQLACDVRAEHDLVFPISGRRGVAYGYNCARGIVEDVFHLLDVGIGIGRAVFQRHTNVEGDRITEDRKSTRLNSSHQLISYAVFCLKKKKSVRSPRLEIVLVSPAAVALPLSWER